MVANYWVLAVGKDCDGFNKGKVYPFLVRSNAELWAKELNDGSDGIVYVVTDSLDTLREYCIDYWHDWTDYVDYKSDCKYDLGDIEKINDNE